jgi:hypothetical protein
LEPFFQQHVLSRQIESKTYIYLNDRNTDKQTHRTEGQAFQQVWKENQRPDKKFYNLNCGVLLPSGPSASEQQQEKRQKKARQTKTPSADSSG